VPGRKEGSKRKSKGEKKRGGKERGISGCESTYEVPLWGRSRLRKKKGQIQKEKKNANYQREERKKGK